MINRKDNMRRRSRTAAFVAVLLAGTSLGGLAATTGVFAPVARAQGGAAGDQSSARQYPVGPESTQGSTHGTTNPAPINPAQAMPARLPSFVGLVKQVKPAVVSVTNYLKGGAVADVDQELPGSPGPGQGDNPGEGGPPSLPFPFNQFPFNQMPHGGNPHGGVPHGHAVEARGSGFIIQPDGLIVTNNHVIKDAKRLEVTLSDGEKLSAKVVGADPRTDIAVLKVDAHHALPYLHLGNSTDVQPGEWVIAIGNPFGLSETVTAGIVSATGRSLGGGPYDQFIQVDAPINQGNSGGPLITQDGNVIGMDTAILSPSGGSIGIGFAIPANLIKQIAGDLQHYGHVTRGYLGVEAQPVTEAISKALNLPTPGGALVAAVQPNTPAAQAGIQPGDVIRSVNGDAIKDPGALALHIAGIKPGSAAKLSVLRDGHDQNVNVDVAELPNQEQVAQQNGGGDQAQPHEARLGLALGPVSPDIAGQLDLPSGTAGAVVTRVQPGSPSEQAGIQAGDVIVGVGT
ncbi:MAG: trypsin-like peptidase domain-containing protein, partial [Pseudomonadota bacterium]|nr:trypsin-like peptidase domain-containing protein [Pseudomonadota bacterium]